MSAPEYGRKHTDGSRSGGQPPRASLRTQPSDSVVEEMMEAAFIEGYGCAVLDPEADYVTEARTFWKHSATKAALAAQPRDDVRELLEWFWSRRFALQSKFDLHGPKDLADAMREHFKRIDTALAPTTQQGTAFSEEWCINMAKAEGEAEIGAGMPDHPLRAAEQPDTQGTDSGLAERLCMTFAANLTAHGWSDCPIGDIGDAALEAAMIAALEGHEITDRKAVLEAWAKRTGTVECTGEAVPYLKIHFDKVDDMRAFNDAIRALAEGEGK